MKVLFVILLALVFVGIIISVTFCTNLTRRGERLFTTGLIVTIASVGAFLTTALAYVLWKGL